MLRNAKVYAHARGGTGCGMLRNVSAQTHKGNRLPAGANYLEPGTNHQNPGAEHLRPGANHLTAAPLVGSSEIRTKPESTQESPERTQRARGIVFPLYRSRARRAAHRSSQRGGSACMMKYDEIPEEPESGGSVYVRQYS